ncbi:MAG: CAP domain-containing protein [Ilumatobacteraceae bacterium]
MTDDAVRSPRNRLARRLPSFVATALLASAIVVGGIATPLTASAIADSDWLAIVNAYRAQSGLEPVSEDTSGSAGARNHACWMLLNGIAHDEQPGTPGYTSSGDAAGNASNVAVTSSSTTAARRHIDLWMSGPFHAVGILRPELTSTSFGMCASPPNPSTTRWKSGAALDVIRGMDYGVPDPTTPIVFPGYGATTSLFRFIAESPDPRTFCGWSGQTVGLPLIAMVPNKVTSANATLSGPSGPISTCVLHGSNTTGTAKAILDRDNVVVIVPSKPLEPGTQTVSVSSSGGNVDWSFVVDPSAPLTDPTSAPEPEPSPPATDVLADELLLDSVTPFRFADSRSSRTIERLPARTIVRVPVGGHRGVPIDTRAISANFTVDGPASAGYLTAYDCSAGLPSVSTLNYLAGRPVANHAIVPLASDGDLCLYSHAATDLIIDVDGYARGAGQARLTTLDPARVLDSRESQPIRPGSPLAVDVEGGASPVPDIATAVVINLTATDPTAAGWIRAYPCDAPEPGSSTLNVQAGRTRANSAIVPTSTDGTICIRSTSTTDLLIDLTGWFGPAGLNHFSALRPIRMADTRSSHEDLNPRADRRRLDPGQELRVPIAGSRGVPADAIAATLNVVATDATAGGFLRVVPCGGGGDVSTLNFDDSGDVANGTTVRLGPSGDVCVTTSATTHVLVDITGIWT